MDAAAGAQTGDNFSGDLASGRADDYRDSHGCRYFQLKRLRGSRIYVQEIDDSAIPKNSFVAWQDSKILGHSSQMRQLLHVLSGDFTHGENVVIIVATIRVCCCEKENIHSVMNEAGLAVRRSDTGWFAWNVRLENLVAARIAQIKLFDQSSNRVACCADEELRSALIISENIHGL